MLISRLHSMPDVYIRPDNLSIQSVLQLVEAM